MIWHRFQFWTWLHYLFSLLTSISCWWTLANPTVDLPDSDLHILCLCLSTQCKSTSTLVVLGIAKTPPLTWKGIDGNQLGRALYLVCPDSSKLRDGKIAIQT